MKDKNEECRFSGGIAPPLFHQRSIFVFAENCDPLQKVKSENRDAASTENNNYRNLNT